jgi:SAM-dependent methyltransferase
MNPIEGASHLARMHNRIFSILLIPSRMRLEQGVLARQYERQSTWLRESLEWLIKTRIVACDQGHGRLSALDVGCGPGIVMEMLQPSFSAIGIDMDSAMVRQARKRGFEAVKALAEDLPFEDASFEVVYCSWLLLWVRDPVKVVAEMKRVSRGWVFCMAEPDYGARIDHPEDLSQLGKILAEGIRRDGGDPFIGRKLRHVFNACGLEPEIGVHPGVWDIERLREEADAEWDFVKMTAGDTAGPERLQTLRESWNRALAAGTLVQFNPVFYALARVPEEP